MKKIISIVGARPQFIKHAPMSLALKKNFIAKTIHTGQHYDHKMSEIFFNDLKIPRPDYHFKVSSENLHGAQTASMMTEIEKVIIREKTDAVLVYGDTNSTLAGALVASKLQIPIIHIEAGLRSYNKGMPEEINRVVTDHLSTLLFCPTPSAVINLSTEGIIHNVYKTGDVMCDILEMMRPMLVAKFDFPYILVTLHRPYNTDNEVRLRNILELLNDLHVAIVFPIHPRTLKKINDAGVSMSKFSNIRFVEPLNYLDSLNYQAFSSCVITDSGGMQKEAYMLKKKCITLRSETEWVETLKNGWNTLIFDDLNEIRSEIHRAPGDYVPNLYGNGNSADEICDIIGTYLN